MRNTFGAMKKLTTMSLFSFSTKQGMMYHRQGLAMTAKHCVLKARPGAQSPAPPPPGTGRLTMGLPDGLVVTKPLEDSQGPLQLQLGAAPLMGT